MAITFRGLWTVAEHLVDVTRSLSVYFKSNLNDPCGRGLTEPEKKTLPESSVYRTELPSVLEISHTSPSNRPHLRVISTPRASSVYSPDQRHSPDRSRKSTLQNHDFEESSLEEDFKKINALVNICENKLENHAGPIDALFALRGLYRSIQAMVESSDYDQHEDWNLLDGMKSDHCLTDVTEGLFLFVKENHSFRQREDLKKIVHELRDSMVAIREKIESATIGKSYFHKWLDDFLKEEVEPFVRQLSEKRTH